MFSLYLKDTNTQNFSTDHGSLDGKKLEDDCQRHSAHHSKGTKQATESQLYDDKVKELAKLMNSYISRNCIGTKQ